MTDEVKTQTISVRVDVEIVKQIDALVPLLPRTGKTPKQADAIRALLLFGLPRLPQHFREEARAAKGRAGK